MQTVADYDIVFDFVQKLGAGAGQDPDKDFTLDINKHVSVETRSVLSWMLHPLSDVTFDITINGKAVVTGFKAPASETHVVQVVVNGNILKSIPPNNLTITVTNGSANFSDMVLLYQVDCPDPQP